MASIQPTRSGGFRVFYTLRGKRTASPVQPTREAAEAWQREHCAALAARTVIDLVGVWEQEQPSEHRRAASALICAAARARGWGAIDGLSGADLAAWQRNASPRTGQYVRTLLRWAARQHHLPVRLDALDWRPPKYPRAAPKPLLTDAQARAIRATARRYGPAAAALIDYLLTYGARPKTACLLQRRHLDVARGELTIEHAKHSGGWRHALDDRHVDAWRRLSRKPDDPIFPRVTEDGTRAWRITRGSASELGDWYRNTIAKRLKLAAAGLDGIYHLKRYAITRMLRCGLDPATVAQFTGHLSLSQVLRYARSNPDLQRDALSRLRAADRGNTNRHTVTR